MQKQAQDTRSIISTVFAGSLCTIILGFIFFQFRIFNVHHPLFQFVAYGIVGSVAFALFLQRSYRDAVFALILLFVLIVIVAGIYRFTLLVTHSFFFLAMVFSILFFERHFYGKMVNIKIARPIVLAGIVAVTFVLASTILRLLFYPSEGQFHFFSNMPIGFLIGLGLGIGFEVSKFLYSRQAPPPDISK